MKNIQKALTGKIDKTKWSKWKFADLVENINQKVTPSKSGLEHYIGLVHLDSGFLKISRFGSTASIKGDKLKIYKGDIIFAKRNAYLKRVAIARFDAVASAHSLVLRAKPENVNPDFLPFFLLSEMFWERAIQISVGSLSPTINWKALKQQEFMLPPKEHQMELAELLWAVDKVIESHRSTHSKLMTLKYKTCEKNFIKGSGSKKVKDFFLYKIPEHWMVKKMSSIANIEYGISKSVANNTEPSIGWPIITGANINLDGTLDMSKKRYIEIPTKDRFVLKKGDLLFNWRSGSIEHIGKTAIFNLEGNYTYASFVLRIRCGAMLDNVYAHYLLNFLREIEFFTKNTSKQINFKINAKIFKGLEIPVPPLEEQRNIISTLKKIDESICHINEKIDLSRKLQKHIIDQVF